MGLTLDPFYPNVGQTVTVYASITNFGEQDGTYKAVLKVDGIEMDSTNVTIAKGGTESVTFEFTKNLAGSYTIEVGDQTRPITFTSLKPASGSISNLPLDPDVAKVGQQVEVSVLASNSGDVEGTFTISLKINDLLKDSQNVTLQGGEQKWVSFTVTESSPGEYKIAIDGLERTLTVLGEWNLSMGQTAETTEIEVTVLSSIRSSFYLWRGISGTLYTTEADPGKIFIIINTEIHYIGTESEYVYGGDFWLIDSNNYKYEYNSGTYSLEGGLEGTTLYQNQRASGKVLFEIPESATGLKVQFNLGTSWEPQLASWTIS